MEDKGKDEPSIWKLEDKNVLIANREAKIDAKKKKEEDKLAKQALDLKKKSTPGKDWFKVFESAKYSKYDDAGLPTHDVEGKALSEAIVNKFKKI